jgi:hypothetical protein
MHSKFSSSVFSEKIKLKEKNAIIFRASIKLKLGMVPIFPEMLSLIINF